MSQSPSSSDTQALLQSMLQRLKLQQGKDGETQQQLHVLNSAVSTCADEAATEAFSPQKLNTGPVDGYEFGTNRIPSKVLRISETNQSTSPKGEVVQKTLLNWEVDKDRILFPAQKDNSDGGTGQSRVAGQDTQLSIPNAGTGQLFPATLSKDANVTSYRSSVETVNIGSVTESFSEQTQRQGYQPKAFAWSAKPTYVTGSPRYRALPVENGECGIFTPTKDTHVTATDQTIERGGFSSKQQSLGKKTRRWTQKIKERWKDRPGSFSKKHKEEQIGQQSEISPLKQLLTTNTIINSSNKEEEAVTSSSDCSDPIKTAPPHTADNNNEVNTRFILELDPKSTTMKHKRAVQSCDVTAGSDFQFGLGSFSLLEEITSGQEWAKFLTPNSASASADQRTLQEVKAPTFSTQSLIPNHSSNNWRGFRDRVASPFSDASVTEAGPGDFQHVSMDVSEEEQCGHRATEQMESMERGHAPSDMRTGRQRRPLSQPADVQNNSGMKSRVQMNRKRHHHLTEATDKDPWIDAQHPDKDVSMSSWSSCEMGATAASPRDGDLPLYACPPLSPSFFPSLADPPKGVLKHSLSQDSQSSVEILRKRRRVEENRRVRFSEEVVTIMPPELDPDLSDPEEDSGEEEDSVLEPEPEEERAGFEEEEEAPARRPALPAWILSLKNRNSQRKHRK